MPQRVQSLRSSVKGSRPTGRLPGEIYTNFADRQIGFVNASNAATDLVAVRYFSAAADYAIGDYVVQAGTLYRAKVAITAGAFNAANWDVVATLDAASGSFVLKAGDTMTGNLTIAPPTGAGVLTVVGGTASPAVTILKKSGSGQASYIATYSGPTDLSWVMYLGDSSVESGGNAGSNFSLVRYDDAGVIIPGGSVISIPRATGIVDLPFGSTTLTQPATDNDTSVATTAFVKSVTGAAPVVPVTTALSTTSWDSITTPGWHTEVLGPSNTSHPVPAAAGAYFYCLVLNYAPASGLVQIAFPHSPDVSQVQGFFHRGRAGGVWNAWKHIAPATAEARNRIVNPAMQVSQEHGTGIVGPGQYPADQWAFDSNGISMTGLKSTSGGKNIVLWSNGTAKPTLAATDYACLRQPIEGVNAADLNWGTAYAIPAVLRLEAGTAAPGLYAVSVMNMAGTHSFIKGVNLTGVLSTFVIPIPAQTAGVWPSSTSQALTVRIVSSAGSSYIGAEGWNASGALGVPGMANLAAVINQNMWVANVGLYADPNNTGLAPPFQMPDEAEELRACQRYYQKVTGMFCGNLTNGAAYIAMTQLPVPMRVGNPGFSGVNVTVNGFPATVGTFGPYSPGNITGVSETRVANVTGNGGSFFTYITANARM